MGRVIVIWVSACAGNAEGATGDSFYSTDYGSFSNGRLSDVSWILERNEEVRNGDAVLIYQTVFAHKVVQCFWRCGKLKLDMVLKRGDQQCGGKVACADEDFIPCTSGRACVEDEIGEEIVAH